MTTLADYVTAVGGRVPDDAGRLAEISTKLSVTDVRESRILAAVRTYSRARPRQFDAEITGDGAAQVFAVPSEWSPDFSVITDWEYPIDLVPPVIIRPVKDRLLKVRRGGVSKIATLGLTLEPGTTGRLHFTTLHTVDVSTDTVPPADFDAVADLAAALVCETLATYYAESTLSTMAADAVQHQAKATLFGQMAELHYNRYLTHMSPGPEADGDGMVLMGEIDIPSTSRGPNARGIFNSPNRR